MHCGRDDAELPVLLSRTLGNSRKNFPAGILAPMVFGKEEN
jgi:hypothetical protein